MLKPVGFLILIASQWAALACKTARPPQEGSEVKVSTRTMIIPDSDIQGIPFNFCVDKPSFSFDNALWLSYFSANQYTHFKELGPALEKLGFGDPGEGEAFQKKWWELRIKRVNEGRIDTDDSWTTPEEKAQKQKELAQSYQTLFGRPYLDDGLTSMELQHQLVGGKTPAAKLQFISGLTLRTGYSEKTSTQALYAEHRQLPLSIVSFRGTEFEEGPDRMADLKLVQTPIVGLGKVHKGMWEAYMEIDQSLLHILRMHSAAKPINLWVTGHSLGGGLAAIFAARIMQLQAQGQLPQVRLVGVYHFGSPRPFDDVAAKTLEELIVKNKVNFVRFRNHKDIVTGLPFGIPGVASEYWHAGALAYFSADGRLTYGDGFEKIEKESDILESFPTEVGDHSSIHYFNLMKKARAASSDQAALSCAFTATDRPLLPFIENPAHRL